MDRCTVVPVLYLFFARTIRCDDLGDAPEGRFVFRRAGVRVFDGFRSSTQLSI